LWYAELSINALIREGDYLLDYLKIRLRLHRDLRVLCSQNP